MIVVVDYGRGNLFSIGQALRHVGAEFEISGDPCKVSSADKVILPGVGAFGDCMHELQCRNLIEPLLALEKRRIPLLGICVGLQVLASLGEEFGIHQGLGLIPGTVKRLPEGSGEDRMRIPNVGWRKLRVHPGHASMFSELPADPTVYFVHSFAPVVDDPSVIAATIDFNGQDVPVALRKGSVMGFQFHPEKSGPVGLQLLSTFVHRQGSPSPC